MSLEMKLFSLVNAYCEGFILLFNQLSFFTVIIKDKEGNILKIMIILHIEIHLDR